MLHMLFTENLFQVKLDLSTAWHLEIMASSSSSKTTRVTTTTGKTSLNKFFS